MIVTNQPLTISYFIRDISGVLATFDRLRWFRSRDGANGTFEAITAAAPAPAVLVSPLVEPHQVNGKTLRLLINGTAVDVTFATSDPASSSAIAGEINAATGLLTADDPGDGTLRLTSTNSGTDTGVAIGAAPVPEDDAAPFLGWAEGDGAVGVDQDTVLVSGTHEYFFTDGNSDRDFFYKVLFFNNGTSEQSEQSVAFPAATVDAVPKSQTIVAFIRLADMTGCPIAGRKVTLHNVFLPNNVAGFGIFRHSLTLVTDRNGYAETRIVRGMDLDMSVDGTGFVRRLTIPTTGDLVDLLDPALVSQDEFGIQEANIDFAIRTS